MLTGSHRVWEYPYSPVVRFGQRISMRVLPPVTAEGADLDDLQKAMKAIALDESTSSPRRFRPTRDGYWDDYSYEIDPEFPELLRQVEEHRSRLK